MVCECYVRPLYRLLCSIIIDYYCLGCAPVLVQGFSLAYSFQLRKKTALIHSGVECTARMILFQPSVAINNRSLSRSKPCCAVHSEGCFLIDQLRYSGSILQGSHRQKLEYRWYFSLLSAGEERDLTITPLAGTALSEITLRVVTHQPMGSIMFADDSSALRAQHDTTEILRKNVQSCQNSSIIHFVTGILIPDNLPEASEDWGVSEGEGNRSVLLKQKSGFQKNSTMIMSVLLVLGVFGLAVGFFWGRYRIRLNAANASNALSSTELSGEAQRAWRLGHDTSSLRWNPNHPIYSEIVPLAVPKVRLS